MFKESSKRFFFGVLIAASIAFTPFVVKPAFAAPVRGGKLPSNTLNPVMTTVKSSLDARGSVLVGAQAIALHHSSGPNLTEYPMQSAPKNTRMNAGSSTVDGNTDITNSQSDELDEACSADGLKIYFSSNATAVDSTTGKLTGTGKEYHIWKMAPDGSLLTAVTQDISGNQREPAISSVGSMLSYAGERSPGSGIYDIWTLDLKTGTKTQLTQTGDNRCPTWDATGTKIAFSSNRGGGAYNLWIFDSAKNTFKQLTSGNSDDITPSWSPDGSKIAFSRDGRIYLTDPLGAKAQQYTNLTINGEASIESNPSWFPNGEYLVFDSTRHDSNGDLVGDQILQTTDIYVLPSVTVPEGENYDAIINGAKQTAVNTPISITSDPGNEFRPSWYADGTNIFYISDRAGTAGLHDIWRTALVDFDAPTLDALPEVTPRQSNPGDTVTIRAKISDTESGVKSVFAQFKDPDSALQDAAGLEHKIYKKNPNIQPPKTTDGSSSLRGWMNGKDPTIADSYLMDEGILIPMCYEIACQEIDPATYKYGDPYVMKADDSHLLPLYDDGPISQGGHEPEGEVAEDGIYTNTWKTPDVPSDFYLDLVTQDNAGNKVIYDNIWGFSTQSFTPGHAILLVQDYGAGQSYMEGKQSPGVDNLPLTRPTESYYTNNVEQASVVYETPAKDTDTLTSLILGGSGPFPGGESSVIPCMFNMPWCDLDSMGSYLTNYDIWRVQCRGAVTKDVLNAYTPTVVQQPKVTNITQFDDKLFYSRCVFWMSPYAGDLRVGPGTIVDPNTQDLLLWYLSQGGRLMLSGQDVAWALTMNGTITNKLLTAMKVSFVDDAADDIISSYSGMRHTLASPSDSGKGQYPISNEMWKWHWDDQYSGFGEKYLPTALYLTHIDPGFVPDASNSKDWHMDGCQNQWWIDNISALTGGTVGYTYSTGGNACVFYADTASNYKTAFFAFGIEGVHDGYSTVSLDSVTYATHLNKRYKLLYNISNWMRQGGYAGTLRDLDPSDGSLTPAQGVLVEAIDDNNITEQGKIKGTAISLADGTYRIDALDSSIYTIWAYKPGYTIQHTARYPMDAGLWMTQDLVLTKAPAGWITGIVTDTKGNPIANAVVTAAEAHGYDISISGISKTDGTYRIDNVSNGDYNVTAACDGYGNCSPESTAVTVQPNTGTSGIDFMLKAIPGQIAGVVTDKDTKLPLADATVMLYNPSDLTNALTAVTTDELGKYEMDSLDVGNYVVAASRSGYTVVNKNATVTSGVTTNVDFELETAQPGSISGTVSQSKDGAPVAGATVNLMSGDEIIATTTTMVSAVATKDASYSYNYKFESVPAGIYSIQAAKDALASDVLSNVTVAGDQETENVNLVLNGIHDFNSGLAMISSPYDYSGQDVCQLLGVDNIKMAHWNTDSYQMYPDTSCKCFCCGNGYFVKLDQKAALITKGSELDKAVPFKITLNEGWNMIGDPFTGNAISWSNCKVEINQVQYSMSDAIAKGFVRDALWEYNSNTGSYQSTQQLQPWKGYWVRALKPCSLVVVYSSAS